MATCDIIAIGGSLGSIAALRRLMQELPPDFAATLLIVVHVGRDSNNLLATVFGRHSPLTVVTATDGAEVLPRHAYVAPAGRHMLVIDGVIRLGQGPRENLARPAIDPLFRSVATCYGARAVGVVLTGMLNDGASGLADVKRCGGIAVVQAPDDAEAPDMPRHALAATPVDHQVPMSDMAALLATLSTTQAGPPVAKPKAIATEVALALGVPSDTDLVMTLADPVPLTCPACGGVLSELRQKTPLRFRCQVGHSYTAEVLATEKEGAADEAVRVALRIMEERVQLTRKLAQNARASGLGYAAASYEKHMQESRDHAEVLRAAIFRL